MDMMVLSGKVSGSVIVADKVYVKLSMPIEGGEVYISDGESGEVYPMHSNRLEISSDIKDIDRCMVVDSDGDILASGVLHGGITKGGMLKDYDRLKDRDRIASSDIKRLDNTTQEDFQKNEYYESKINTNSEIIGNDIADSLTKDTDKTTDGEVSNNTSTDSDISSIDNSESKEDSQKIIDNQSKINTNSEIIENDSVDERSMNTDNDIDSEVSNNTSIYSDISSIYSDISSIYDSESIEVSQKIIDNQVDGDGIVSIQDNAQKNLENTSKIVTSSESVRSFFDKVHSDIESMFQTFSHDQTLEQLVYESEWIDVPYQDSYYVVGMIKEKGIPAIIAYGIPCDSIEAKAQYSDYDWLPIDRENADGKGYCLRYQNALDGSMIDSAMRS